MSLRKTFEVLSFQWAQRPDARLLATLEAGQWKHLTVSGAWTRLRQYGRWLLDQGLQPGERMLLVPDTATADWILLDLAAQHLGLVVVLMHATSSRSHLRQILEETQVRIAVVKDAFARAKFFEGNEGVRISVLYGETEALGRKVAEWVPLPEEHLARVGEGIQPEDLSVIIYTSGTTGKPKGVMLSHANIMSNLGSILPLLPLKPGYRALSMLPYSHIFERTLVYGYLWLGLEVFMFADKENIQERMERIKPHFFVAVPRIIEKMYEEVWVYRQKQGWMGRKLIDWALKVGERYREGRRFDARAWWQVHLARQLVFRRFRRKLGGKVIGIAVGAAHLDPKLARILAVAGIPLREGYGMTETSPVVAVNRYAPGLNRFGTVGLPLPGVNIHIHNPDASGQGEIWVKGPNVMLGYYRQPEETTRALLPDGWLQTGDLGHFQGKFLVISGRKKDLFKTSSGKYIVPQVLENHFRQSPFLSQLIVLGYKRPFVSALIFPNYALLEAWAQEAGIHWTSPTYMAHNIKVIAKIKEEIDQLNTNLPSHEKLRRFHLLAEPWSPEAGQLSNTLKPIRDRIMKDFEKEIAEMYR